MKISTTTKVLFGAALLAPLAMYAGAADIGVLNDAYDTVKGAIGGPIKGLLIGAEIVTGVWMYSQSKNPAILLGIPVVAAVTALGIGAMH
ncbi:MAG: hypothetical protein KBD25_00660 [Rickettsiaceae bacterium]|nr:hypothetical protein [Rickettsiaceae bacterium]